MPVTLDTIRDALGAPEPEYSRLAGEFGGDALPLLKQLSLSGDARIANRAIHLVSMIPSDMAESILQEAARFPNERIRVAVSAAAATLEPQQAARVLLTLLQDTNTVVRRIAARSVETNEAIEQIIDPMIRSLDGAALNQFAELKKFLK
jgi:HEAT repeats